MSLAEALLATVAVLLAFAEAAGAAGAGVVVVGGVAGVDAAAAGALLAVSVAFLRERRFDLLAVVSVELFVGVVACAKAKVVVKPKAINAVLAIVFR